LNLDLINEELDKIMSNEHAAKYRGVDVEKVFGKIEDLMGKPVSFEGTSMQKT
jgi:hypothetical protein